MSKEEKERGKEGMRGDRERGAERVCGAQGLTVSQIQFILLEAS